MFWTLFWVPRVSSVESVTKVGPSEPGASTIGPFAALPFVKKRIVPARWSRS